MSTHGLSSPAGEPYFVLEKLWLSEPATPAPVAQAKRDDVPAMIDMDGANVFVMMTSLLFVPQMATYGAALFTLSVLVLAFRHRGSTREVFRNYGFFLLFPGYALLSTLWSETAVETLKHSGEFAITVFAALLFTQIRNRRSVMFALFAAFAVYAIGSMALGNSVAVGTNGTTAIAGLAESKNEEASVMTIGAIISLAWLCIGIKTRRYVSGILALPVLALEVYLAVAAKSAGGVAALAIGLMFFLLLAALAKMGRRLRVAMVGFGGITALAGAIIFMIFTAPIVEVISTWFGKDVTLTGRTYLWARAHDLVAEHPLLGRGYAAFWQQGNLDAEGLWQFAHIASRSGFNFHNTSQDVLVSLGWLGLALFVMTLVVGMVKMGSAYVRRPSLLAAFWLALGSSFVVRLPVETMGTYEFSFATVLLFAIFSYTVTEKDPAARPALQPEYAPNPTALSPIGPYAL